MISMDELLNKKYKLEDQSPEIQDNLKVLLERVNQIRQQWNKPMTVTSGLRTMDDHLRIYEEKANKHQAPFQDGVFDKSKVPMKSKHLYGQAVDIFDPDLEITKWLKANPEILEKTQLWCEDGNSNWIHFQIIPPNSGRRWFMP